MRISMLCVFWLKIRDKEDRVTSKMIEVSYILHSLKCRKVRKYKKLLLKSHFLSPPIFCGHWPIVAADTTRSMAPGTRAQVSAVSSLLTPATAGFLQVTLDYSHISSGTSTLRRKPSARCKDRNPDRHPFLSSFSDVSFDIFLRVQPRSSSFITLAGSLYFFFLLKPRKEQAEQIRRRCCFCLATVPFRLLSFDWSN